MVSLVVGAAGLVGYEFYRQKKDDGEWQFTYHSRKLDGFVHLDATDERETKEVMGAIAPDIVVLPAAYANVNGCETEREKAYANNVGIVRNVLAEMDGGGKIVFFSTDYLFDGKNSPYSEEAKPNPLNYYGKLKLLCEEEIQKSGVEYLIIRTTGVFGWEQGRKNFLYRVLDTLSAGHVLEVPNDQFTNATYVRDLALAAQTLLSEGRKGVFNVVGSEEFSKEGLAREYASALSLDEKLIAGKPSSHFRSVAPRPVRSALGTKKIEALGIRIRPVREAVADMIKRKEEDDVYPPG